MQSQGLQGGSMRNPLALSTSDMLLGSGVNIPEYEFFRKFTCDCRLFIRSCACSKLSFRLLICVCILCRIWKHREVREREGGSRENGGGGGADGGRMYLVFVFLRGPGGGSRLGELPLEIRDLVLQRPLHGLVPVLTPRDLPRGFLSERLQLVRELRHLVQLLVQPLLVLRGCLLEANHRRSGSGQGSNGCHRPNREGYLLEFGILVPEFVTLLLPALQPRRHLTPLVEPELLRASLGLDLPE